MNGENNAAGKAHLINMNTYGEYDNAFPLFLERELRGRDNLELFYDGENPSQEKKEEQDEFFQHVLNGDVTIEGNVVSYEDKEWDARLAADLVGLIEEYSQNIAYVDSGPVLDPGMLENGKKALQVKSRIGGPQDLRLTQEESFDGEMQEQLDEMSRDIVRLTHVDKNYEEHIVERVETPDNVLIIRDAYSMLAGRLTGNEEYDFVVEEVNEKMLPEHKRKRLGLTIPPSINPNVVYLGSTEYGE